MKIESFFHKIVNSIISSKDSCELTVKKRMLVLMTIIISIVAAIWGIIYAIYEHYLSASIPSSYALISIITLYYSSKTKNHEFLQNSQLVLVLFLPFFLMWSLGGFRLGSYVMIWAFYAPLVVASFQINQSYIWFFLFSILTLFSALIENLLSSTVTPLPEEVIISFMILNIISGFGGIFYMLIYHIKMQISFSKDLNLAHHAIRKKNEDLRLLANHDYLTKILNRRGIEDTLSREIARAKRYKQSLSIILLDVDNFKSINDLYGHNNGDIVLKKVSNLLSNSIRISDYCGRWGGEEFLLILPQTSQHDARSFANKLRLKISKCNFNPINKVTCSFGVFTSEGEISSVEAYIKNADMALYQAKDGGKNCVKIWRDELSSINS